MAKEPPQRNRERKALALAAHAAQVLQSPALALSISGIWVVRAQTPQFDVLCWVQKVKGNELPPFVTIHILRDGRVLLATRIFPVAHEIDNLVKGDWQSEFCSTLTRPNLTLADQRVLILWRLGPEWQRSVRKLAKVTALTTGKAR